MSSSTFKPLWIVPCYHHEASLKVFVPQLLATQIPVLVVDDGNETPISPIPGAMLVRCDVNGGKGAALEAGAKWAQTQGYTHLIQIDADGQHAVADALAMVEAAKAEPHTLFSGFPVYDDSVPKAREKGREVTRFFIRLETGLKREDALCGCRVYPLKQFLEVVQKVRSRQMGFDPEMVVKWVWQGYAVKQHLVHVTYPLDGVSNFRMLRDNMTFFAVHARLCCGRLLRWLRILR